MEKNDQESLSKQCMMLNHQVKIVEALTHHETRIAKIAETTDARCVGTAATTAIITPGIAAAVSSTAAAAR
jgi:hypothetical protein